MFYFHHLRPKTIEISRGEFPCPNCRKRSAYCHKERVERRLVLFVPIQGDTIEEYIECQSCQAHFPLGVLRTKVPESEQQVLENLKSKLTEGMSIEEAESRLSEAGMPIGTIKQYVSVAAGIGRKRCPECNLTYRNNVSNCRKCSHQLPAASNIIHGGTSK